MSQRLTQVVSVLVCLFATALLPAQVAEQPTKEHQILADEVGHWTAEMKVYAIPGQPPFVSQATEKCTMLGSLWLLTEFESSFDGQAFVGRGQYGYDAKKKKYVGTWVDSMSTSISVMEGTYDATTKTLSMSYEGTDSQTGQPATYKAVTEYKSKDTRIFTMYQVLNDNERKLFEISYRREKKK